MALAALGSLGLLVIGSIPTVIGVAEAIDAQKKQNAQAKERIKFHLTVKLSPGPDLPLQEGTVVLKDGKVYLDHPAHPVSGYKFNGFYFGYPGPENHQGMVSMASDDPPALHWIYVDKDTGELRHGSRGATAGHVIGPWNWSEDEEFVVLENSPYFFAVEEDDGAWSLYHDQSKKLVEKLAPRKVAVILLHRELQLGVSSRMVGGKEK
ncbi:hypothetical protein JX265_010902 [Neoarthrinium moseri]|uniref:Uncharacterized protein n=1 Tax=Neoarthrinium moseri TaxID=1658444 RepID=A0A9P9WDT8_9PEZI|nr:uncharacterized protein JN550_008987 [Neoarthrinium moseri]KAI1846318.1 hypothetical protein JX266_007523 [Neoarthrinium moseri]KAI1858234.1 hypothetical protein JX265_010902 [Neoarthrinium moseri]KAI1864430.1 hypothetical protein JN550_008987 [Neoarthrinium moseri]